MKTKFYLSALLLISVLFVSCKKDGIEYESQFEKSYKTWTSFKASSNNSYIYTVTTSSWIGSRTETVITVLNGEVVHRSFVAKSPGEPPASNLTIYEEWAETKATLNTHTSGAKTMTLDEIYELAKSELLKKRSGAKTYFEAKNSGMISSCGYIENGCQDDCSIGIYIASIKKLEGDYITH